MSRITTAATGTSMIEDLNTVFPLYLDFYYRYTTSNNNPPASSENKFVLQVKTSSSYFNNNSNTDGVTGKLTKTLDR